MSRLLSIAARNLRRNLRRTVLSALAVVVGVGAAVSARAFLNGFVAFNLDDAVNGKAGAIQVHKAGWREADHNLLDYLFADEPALRDRIARVPGIRAVAPRISFEGMLANGTLSTMVMATAVDPGSEYRVCPRRRDNVQPGGRPIEPEDRGGSPGDAVIGATIGSFLGARPGDPLTLQSATRTGTSNAQEIAVRGFLPPRFIFESKRIVTVPLAFAQSLLGAEGHVTEYAVGVDNLDDVDATTARLGAALGPGYSVESWKTIAPDARDRVERVSIVLGVVLAILALLVATGIVNTMMMAVFERVREIGTMMAVGVRRRQVLLLFLLEAGVLGLLGAIAGVAVGMIPIVLFSHGVPMKPPGGEPILLVPIVKVAFLIKAVALATIGCMFAALLPAWRASRLRPVDALRAV